MSFIISFFASRYIFSSWGMFVNHFLKLFFVMKNKLNKENKITYLIISFYFCSKNRKNIKKKNLEFIKEQQF